MTLHRLKTWPEPFAAVAHGEKRFEVRQDDRGFSVGDTLQLREWNRDNGYTGRAVECVVTYIARGPDWGTGLPTGLVVMSLGPALRLTP